MKNKSFLILVLLGLLGLVFSYKIDREFFLISRIGNTVWEPYGGEDYSRTGIDFFSSGSYILSGDTIQFKKNNKKFLIQYSIFSSLWIKDINTGKTSKYVKFVSIPERW